TVFGLGAGFGFGVAVVMLAAIRTRLAYADLPNGLRGLGIAFTIAGMMSLGFSAFAQMVSP
ncbi:MAG: Rnf-Nqr domain containing protein, partial [Martelella sp.]